MEKCPAYLKVNKTNLTVISLTCDHNHDGSLSDINKRKVEAEIKKQIREGVSPFKKVSSIVNNIVADGPLNLQKDQTLRQVCYKEIKKLLPDEVDSIKDIPDDCPYFYTKLNQRFYLEKTMT